MHLSEYQSRSQETAIYPTPIVYPTLGLVGEAGEVAEKVKKVIRDNGGEFDQKQKEAIAKELGDVLWYIAAVSNDLGISLEDIALANLYKLQSRQERGKLSGSGDNR